jgi:small multidrug resistance family-3 protein
MQRLSKGKQMIAFPIVLLIFVAAALFEVVGDARIRSGMQSRSASGMALGLFLLCVYGILINLVIHFKIVVWGFSKQLGVYVALFALVSTLVGYRYFEEKIPLTHWLGLGLIVFGGLLIQAAQE